MTVFLSTNSCEHLLRRKQLKQTVQEITTQRGSLPLLHTQLTTELHRQICSQREKKRILSAGLSPWISNRSNAESSFPRKMHLKVIKNRVTSALPTGQDALCDRRDSMQDVKLGRHFCELLGPRLCVDCIKASERIEALKESKQEPSSFHLDREPFNAFVCSYLSKQHEEDESYTTFDNDSFNQEEFSDLDELTNKELQSPHFVSKVILSPSPPGTGDSGFSSRVSRIRGLTRSQSCSFIRNFTPFTPLRREKTQAPRVRGTPGSSDSRKSSGFVSLSREYSLDRYGFLSTIQKLHKRSDMSRYEKDISRAWSKSPVEPVLMELKLINFTQYTDLGYEPPPVEPEPQPQVSYDEFGFPIMENLSL